MSVGSVFAKVGNGIVTGVEDVGKAIADVVTIGVKAEKVLATVKADEAELKTALVVTLKQGVTVSADFASVIAVKGTSWTEDAQLVADVEAFFGTVNSTLKPVVEKVYEDIKVDLEPVQQDNGTAPSAVVAL